MTPEILYISKNVVVIYKPASIASQSDNVGDKDAILLTKELLKERGERGEIYLINRLDRVVGGLMLFARNKESAAKLSALLTTDKIRKEYLAVTDGSFSDGELVDWLCKDSVASKASVATENTSGAKKAVLVAKIIDIAQHKGKEKCLVHVDLKTGRFHQIRAQLSSRGAPISGDKKYGSRDFLLRMPALFAYKLEVHLGDEHIKVCKMPPEVAYPWNLFANNELLKPTEEEK